MERRIIGWVIVVVSLVIWTIATFALPLWGTKLAVLIWGPILAVGLWVALADPFIIPFSGREKKEGK